MRRSFWEQLSGRPGLSLWDFGSEVKTSMYCETNYQRPNATWPLSKRRARSRSLRSAPFLTLCLMAILVSVGCCSSATPVPGKPQDRTEILRTTLKSWEMLDDAWIVPFKDMDLLLLDRRQWKTWALAQEKANGRP